MKRRKFIAGLGALTSGGAAAIGSGAFTTVEAERSLQVRTARDSSAFLKMEAIGAAQRSKDGDVVTFRFPSFGEKLDIQNDPNPHNPQGLGTDSIYRFASDVNGSNGLFIVENQGTQTVELYSTQENGTGVPDVDIFDVETGDLLTEDYPYDGLGVGESVNLGFKIDTTGVSVQDEAYQIDLTIVAEALSN